MNEKFCLVLALCITLADGALALGLLLYRCLYFDAGQFRVNHDAATIFAHDNLLVHLDIELTLGRNLVEATAASITLHIDNAQAVAGILADALETGKKTRLNLCFQIAGLHLQHFLFLTGFLHDFIKFGLLLAECLGAVFNEFFALGEFLFLLLYLNECLTDFLVAELYFKILELYFLGQGVILTIVLHIVELPLYLSTLACASSISCFFCATAS